MKSKKSFLLWLFAATLFVLPSCDNKDDDSSKNVPITVSFIQEELGTDQNDLELPFTVEPADAKIEVEALIDGMVGFSGICSTSDKEYIDVSDPTAYSLRVESVDNLGDGLYVLNTKFYFKDTPMVLKDECKYHFEREQTVILLKNGVKSNNMKVVLYRPIRK